MTSVLSPAASLAHYSTFRLGGPCARLVCCESVSDLREEVSSLGRAGESFVLLGGGSNVLISDSGLSGTVLRYARDDLSVMESNPNEYTVSGASSLDALAAWSARNGLGGLICCTGIPGTVAGAVVGNAGAWGQQIGDRTTSVTLMDRTGATRSASPEQLGFSYRNSRLKKSQDIVVDVTLKLFTSTRAELLAERSHIPRTRAEKHPNLDKDPCIGSFFRNIEASSAAERRQAAGWFLEQVGAKGMRVGGARVFGRHANIIVRGPGCTAQDVRDLAEMMKLEVRGKFGLELVREVRFLGRFEGEPDRPWHEFM